jgi:hypothetical protein
MTTLNENEKRDLYYAQNYLAGELKRVLKETRNEPGLSLKDISNIIKKVLKPEEIISLIRFFKEI